jgi:hypothetical protein
MMTESNFDFLTSKSDKDEVEENGQDEQQENDSDDEVSDQENDDTESESTDVDDSEDDQEEQPRVQRTIEQQLHEERGWRKRLSEELKETKAQLAELMSRADLMMSKMNQPQEQEEEQPDPDSDPLGYIAHEMAAMRNEIKALKGERESEKTTIAQREQHALIMNAARESSEAFLRKNPDFTEAMNFLTEARTRELKAMGISETKIRDALENDVLVITANALQNGGDPATMLYNVAKGRGFRSKRQNAPAPNTLGSVLGTPNPTGKNKDVSLMSDKEFDAFFNKLRKMK